MVKVNLNIQIEEKLKKKAKMAAMKLDMDLKDYVALAIKNQLSITKPKKSEVKQ